MNKFTEEIQKVKKEKNEFEILLKNEQFEIKRPSEIVGSIPKAWVLESGDIRITPASSDEKYGLDGFYICYLHKKPNTFEER